MKRVLILWCLCSAILAAEAQVLRSAPDNHRLWSFVKRQMPEFASVFSNQHTYRLEIIYTRIAHREGKAPAFTLYHWGDRYSYFYPASVVKLPLAIAVLEKMRDRYPPATLLETDSAAWCGQPYRNYYPAYTAAGGAETLAMIEARMNLPEGHLAKLNQVPVTDSVPASQTLLRISEREELRSLHELLQVMLVVSDNEAYNLLFEFVGLDALNGFLLRNGFTHSWITRRLRVCNETEQRATLPLRLYLPGVPVPVTQASLVSQASYAHKVNRSGVGEAQYLQEALRRGGRDFSGHNRISLYDLNRMLVKLVFEESLPGVAPYAISPADRFYLLRLLGLHPREMDRIQDTSYAGLYDGYTNYILNGRSAEPIPATRRMFNIIGQAYGFSTDCAYVFDAEKDVEFFLAVRIYTNRNKVVGDGIYEYDTVALPFMKKLGEVLLRYEVSQKKKALPYPDYLLQLFR